MQYEVKVATPLHGTLLLAHASSATIAAVLEAATVLVSSVATACAQAQAPITFDVKVRA